MDENKRVQQFERVGLLPLEYMPSPDFEKRAAEREILAPLPRPERPSRLARAPAGLPSYLASLYEVPLLTREQERHLFRKYNYLKYRASRLRDALNPRHPSLREMDRIEDLYRQAVETKNQIIRANLRLVVSVAKKYVDHPDALFDLVSEGNMSLYRAVEKFDYGRGFKFSTYAMWAIKKNYIRAYQERMRLENRFHTSQDEALAAATEWRSDPWAEERAQQQREVDVAKILGCLTERERDIVALRYGLTGVAQAQTLEEIGSHLGVSKERVRQLERRALAKLREAAEAERIESVVA